MFFYESDECRRLGLVVNYKWIILKMNKLSVVLRSNLVADWIGYLIFNL